ncbi:MAG: methyltransferase domain-containing protein [Candidatus Woesearchaeota archaeon]
MGVKSIERFYNEFDFEKMITGPPRPIQEYLDEEVNFLKKHIQPRKNILEIGCGYGRLLEVLSLKAKKVIGIDYSKQLLNKAKQKLIGKTNAELRLMNAKKLDFEDNSFDYVVCLDNTYGNMPGIEFQVLKEMVRVCKPKGEIIISVFSENAKDVQIENYKRIGLTNVRNKGNAIHTDEGFYSRRFTREDLMKLFWKARLKSKITRVCSVNYMAFAIKQISKEDFLVKKESEIHGHGIFAKKNIPKGEIFYKVPINKISKKARPGLAYIGGGIWVNDEKVLNWVNHSCNPNTSLVVKKPLPLLLAIRNIKKGEEITCNYNKTEIGGIEVQCSCKDRNCKKYFLRKE